MIRALLISQLVLLTLCLPAVADDDPPPAGEAQDRDAALAAAQQLYEAGKTEEAIAAFEVAGKDAPLATTLVIAEYLCLRKREIEAGSPYAQRCHEGGTLPQHSIPWLTSLLLSGKTRQLETECRTLLTKYPDSAPIRFQLGVALHRQQKSIEALAVFEHLVERFPKNPSYRYGLADVLFNMRREKEAEVQFRKVLDLEPDNRGAVCRLAETVSFLGRYEEADAMYRTAIKNRNREAAFLYGKFLFQRDRFEEALFYFKRWTKEYPDQAVAWSYLGRCQLQLERPKAAKKAMEKFRELEKKNIKQEDAELLRLLQMDKD